MHMSLESPAYEHAPGKGRLLWLDGAWSCSGARPRATVFHPAYEVGIILSGEEHIFFDSGLELTLQRGDVWLCNAWEVHGWAVAECGVRSVVPHFLAQFLGEADIGIGPWQRLFAAPPELRPYARDRETREHFVAIGEDLSRESWRKRPSWEHLVRLAVLHVLTELAREWEPPAATDERAARGVQLPHLPERLMPALVLAQGPPTRKVSVTEAAEACSLSRSRFQAEFRRAAGISFGHFCVRMRLRTAEHLLASSDLSVREVAARTGFHDDSHLHRFFLREYGQTPGDYRASHRQPRA